MPAPKVTHPYHSARSERPWQYSVAASAAREQTRLTVGVLRGNVLRQEAVGHQVERYEDESQDDRIERLRRPVPQRPRHDLLARDALLVETHRVQLAVRQERLGDGRALGPVGCGGAHVGHAAVLR